MQKINNKNKMIHSYHYVDLWKSPYHQVSWSGFLNDDDENQTRKRHWLWTLTSYYGIIGLDGILYTSRLVQEDNEEVVLDTNVMVTEMRLGHTYEELLDNCYDKEEFRSKVMDLWHHEFIPDDNSTKRSHIAQASALIYHLSKFLMSKVITPLDQDIKVFGFDLKWKHDEKKLEMVDDNMPDRKCFLQCINNNHNNTFMFTNEIKFCSSLCNQSGFGFQFFIRMIIGEFYCMKYFGCNLDADYLDQFIDALVNKYHPLIYSIRHCIAPLHSYILKDIWEIIAIYSI
jgi:hypothetical protein